MAESRIRNAVRNFKHGIVNTVIISLVPFLTRTVFIYILGKNYLGIDALFLNVINLLEIVNVGIGSAITYSVYKPIADGDTEKCKSLFRLYKRCYWAMGTVIFLLGLGLTPFLNVILKNKPNIPENIYLIYLIILSGVSIGYFFMDKQCVINAHQKNYIISSVKSVVIIGINILEIIFLLITKQFLVYLVIQTAQNIIINLCVSWKAKRMYPQFFGGSVAALEKQDKDKIIKNTAALILNRAGSLIINCTDSIVISSFVGVNYVGLYSNYFTLKNMVNTFTSMFTQSLTAGVGNLNATVGEKNKEKLYDTFKQIFFMNYFLHAFCTICLACLLEPFIHIWIGDGYIMGLPIVIIVSINFYFIGVQKAAEQFKAACGLYWQDRFRVFIEAIMNIVVSIILARSLGVLGVLLGTFISNLLVTAWLEPYIVYKYALKQRLSNYLKTNALYILITTALAIGIYALLNLVFGGLGGIGQFVLRTGATVLLSAGGLCLVFFRNPYFKKTITLAFGMAKPILQRFVRKK
ncbi:MAG: oligosaccharide flippase family protein [Clostridia bacterium]|nr:oligosaccharide flippase family protein [Clostridia bacterium]